MAAKFVIAKREALLKAIEADLPDAQAEEAAAEQAPESDRGTVRALAALLFRRFAHQS